MRVFKFGGASVRDAAAVINVATILKTFPKQDLIVVVSAMGKMTNALEDVVSAYRSQDESLPQKSEAIYDYHAQICDDFGSGTKELTEKLDALYAEFKRQLGLPPSDNYDYDYDQIVSFGELFSSTILSGYLNAAGVENQWADARSLIRTDNGYREARVNWEKTEALVGAKWKEIKGSKHHAIMLTQGFLGHTAERNTTTLGREGSDFSAAILAYAVQAGSVTIWKDVPGVLNADPKYFSDAIKLKRISYKEAIELAYYGASVIHPKTIKPLQNKKIVLHVRSFMNLGDEGTTIDSSTFSDSLVASYIFKVNQVLISFTPRDFSFVAEENLSELFHIFSDARVKINLMQQSAINFSVCVDNESEKLDKIIAASQNDYEVLYNHPCELVTIRHYDQETISRMLIGKKVLVEQRSRSTARLVLMEA